jgi:hypothetical protein
MQATANSCGRMISLEDRTDQKAKSLKLTAMKITNMPVSLTNVAQR